MLKQLKKICIESQELLCLISAQDVTQNIIKFGMLSQYPHFMRHFEDMQAVVDADEELE